jgi:hypothetical protein
MPNHIPRPGFIGGLDLRIIMADDEPNLSFRPRVERDDLPFGVATTDPNRRWYGAIIGRIPVGRHVAAVCYASAAILLGWWPWNFLLLLLLFPIGNKRVFGKTRSNRPMQPSCTRGSSL